MNHSDRPLTKDDSMRRDEKEKREKRKSDLLSLQEIDPIKYKQLYKHA